MAGLTEKGAFPMEVLKVVAEGLTTSFRYPHFMQGVHPTFEMPPPATLYGHICSALGDWFDPQGVMFAIHFTFQGVGEDLEHIHVLVPTTGELQPYGVPKVQAGAVNPFRRGFLFRPKLTLYVNCPDWAPYFRSPRYPVALGRSQDLFTYTQVSTIRLFQTSSVYFEHTLAPYSFARRMASGVVVLMPRFLDQDRYPTFGRYVVLHHRVFAQQFLRMADEPEPLFWADPTAPVINGSYLGLAFHSWNGEDESTLRLA